MQNFNLNIRSVENGFIIGLNYTPIGDGYAKNYVARDEKELADLVKKLALEAKAKEGK